MLWNATAPRRVIAKATYVNLENYLIENRAKMGVLQETIEVAIQRDGTIMKARFDVRTKADPLKLLKVRERAAW